VIASAATVTYLVYRIFWTMNLASVPAGIFSGILLVAEAYAGLSLGLYFFQVWRLVEPPLRRPTALRTVDVFVTTCNEDVALLRGTLTACLAMDYPHTTYVLDDGARDEVRRFAEELGIRYISRTDRTHAKAGNINNAMRQTDGEFVIVLDADHLPYRHFITRLMGYFDDPRMGFVQVPHTTYNLDNFMGRWKTASKAYWEDVRIFFEAVQLGKNRFGVACFCGSAAIFRRKAIEDVGGFATETITEDMHTGMRINAAGWKSIAVSEEMVVGLAPDDAATFANQRLRWGEGNLSVMAYDNPLTMKGLTFAGRINYLASIASWTMGPARLILYLTPVVMLLTGIAPVAGLSINYIAIVGCYLVAVWTAVKLASNGCGQLIGIEMAMMASFHLQLQALWRAIFHRRRQNFIVTKKRRTTAAQSSGLRLMWPQAALVAVSIVAISWAVSRVLFGLSADYFGLLVGSGLAMYHSWLALNVLGRATAKRDPNEQWRHPLCLAVDYSIADGNKSAVSVEFNENGCRLLTWERLELGQPLSVMFYSPVGQIACQGRVASSAPLDRRKPFAHLSNVVFEQVDPLQRERESDVLRGIILSYVVPLVTMTHRLVHQGTRTLPEELSGEDDFPIPLVVNPNQPDLAIQPSVALSLNKRGFLAALPVSCVVGSIVQARLNTPIGSLVADVEVHDVETMRVGATIVHQHEFHWRDPSVIRRMIPKRKHWKAMLLRTAAQMQNHRQSTAPTVLAILAGYLIAIATMFLFNQSHRTDILLASMGRQPTTTGQEENVKAALGRMAESSSASADQLSRAYRAAVAIGDDELAAKMAKRLADRVESGRFGWLLTHARHLARAKDYRAADAAFDRLLTDPMERSLALDEQAEMYVEAARAAIAVNNLNKAVERFLQASNLKAADPEQAEELLGVLIAAKQTQLAIQVLRQLDRSDRVLRRIVDVYEMANQPEKAVPELEELYRRHPDDARVVQRLAELAVMRHESAAGYKYYNALQKLEPDNEKARIKYAEALLLAAREDVAAGRYGTASSLFEEAFRIQPPDDKVKREYGGFLAVTGHFDQAVSILEPLKDTDSRLQLAAVLEMQGNLARALRLLLDLEKEQTVGDKAERSIVRLLLADQQYEEAATRLVELLRREPADPHLQREFLDAVAASDHWSDVVRRTMGDVYHQYRESSFHGMDATGFERLGDALRQLDMFEEARVALSYAIDKYPQIRRLRFDLAQTLGSLGRYDDAEAQYTILLATRPLHP
jgi:cellulose synthase/poly-beta-1,6-N-acetylglucosamine synthase-like glycosyltransferase/tetratricopeptide (TPR) repeat protein